MRGTELASTSILTQRIGSSLDRTVWRLGRQQQAGRAIVLIEDGGATVETSGEPREFLGPALCWLNAPQLCRLSIAAGSTGYIAEIAEDMVTRAVGDFSEAPMLGFVLEADLDLALDARGDSAAALASLVAIHAEQQAPRSGSGMAITAHLRILLVAMLRLSGLEDAQPQGGGSNARFLQRFRQLVEGNFRAHWPIARYAETIGISHDRLHSVCRRVLQKSPKALVAERLAREAGLGLERSALSIEQLSYALGFRDPAHFSHFFKRMTGMAPGTFRRLMARTAPGQAASPANFADWP
jgi:AraC family transcriptional activator of pobA